MKKTHALLAHCFSFNTGFFTSGNFVYDHREKEGQGPSGGKLWELTKSPYVGEVVKGLAGKKGGKGKFSKKIVDAMDQMDRAEAESAYKQFGQKMDALNREIKGFTQYLEARKFDANKLHNFQNTILKLFREMAQTLDKMPKKEREAHGIDLFNKVKELDATNVLDENGKTWTNVWDVVHDTAGQGSDTMTLILYHCPSLLGRFEKVLQGGKDADLNERAVLNFLNGATSGALDAVIHDNDFTEFEGYGPKLDKKKFRVFCKKLNDLCDSTGVYERLEHEEY